MRRLEPVLAALAVSAAAALLLVPVSSGAPAAWSGSASCRISIAGPGYQHSETQSWQVGGTARVRGSFVFVPSTWTDSGGGSSHVMEGDQSRDIDWKVKATKGGSFQFVIRASDGKLLVGQANAQLRVAGGVTGTQKLTIGGVEQTPGPVDLEAFETQLPHIVVNGHATSVSGSYGPTLVKGSFGPFQPGAARVTKSCSWRFRKSG